MSSRRNGHRTVHLSREVEVGAKTLSELTNELAEVGAAALLEVLASSDLLAHLAPTG